MSLTSIENQNGRIWMDGRFVDWNQANLHVLSHGLNYATCVFEGERVYSGKVFKLEEHTDRLLRSARLLGFRIPFSAGRLNEATRQVVEAQKIRNGYVRPVAWRGHEFIGVHSPGASTHVAIAAVPMGEVFSPEARKAGLSLKVSAWARPAPNVTPAQSKTSSHYAVASLAIGEAVAAGFDDALLLDHRGNVAESTGANIFFVRDGSIFTPTTECVLDGITRRAVISLAKSRGLEVVERRVGPGEMALADEVFLTGTAYEVIPVSRIGEIRYPAIRPITELLAADYFKLVGKEEVVVAGAS